MSKLKVDQISKATGASPAIFTLPAADGTVNQLMKTDGAGNLGFVSSAVGGKVLQVVQSVKTDTTSTTDHSGSFVDITGMTVDITPSATASKVFVLFSLVVSTATTNRMLNVRLLRDAVTPILGDTAGSRIRISTTTITARVATMVPLGMEYLDSPSTTSAVTYKLQWSLQQAGTGYLNRAGTDTDDNTHARGASTITVMEIGA